MYMQLGVASTNFYCMDLAFIIEYMGMATVYQDLKEF